MQAVATLVLEDELLKTSTLFLSNPADRPPMPHWSGARLCQLLALLASWPGNLSLTPYERTSASSECRLISSPLPEGCIRVVPRVSITSRPPRIPHVFFTNSPATLLVSDRDRISLNVGGTSFQTSPATAAKLSRLAGVATGAFFDRDPSSFEVILNACRRGLPPSRPAHLRADEWSEELRFWGLNVAAAGEVSVPKSDDESRWANSPP